MTHSDLQQLARQICMPRIEFWKVGIEMKGYTSILYIFIQKMGFDLSYKFYPVKNTLS